jgi:hypothetical protein
MASLQSRDRRVRIRVRASTADLTKIGDRTSSHEGSCRKKENPRGKPRGETVSRFFLRGYAGLRQLGLSFKASQPMMLGLPGFDGASVIFLAGQGWEDVRNAQRPESLDCRVSRSGRLLRGVQQTLPRPEHLLIQPVVSALRSALI